MLICLDSRWQLKPKRRNREFLKKERPAFFNSNSWAPEEDDQLIKDFDAGVPLRELSLKFGRNMGAIQTRLLTLGRKIF